MTPLSGKSNENLLSRGSLLQDIFFPAEKADELGAAESQLNKKITKEEFDRYMETYGRG